MQCLAPAVTILISGTRQTKDDFIDGEACSVGEIPVLKDDQPSVFKRPSTNVIHHESHAFCKRISKWC